MSFFSLILFFLFHHSTLGLLKVKLLYFCFAFYDDYSALQSKSHICYHASSDWLGALTSSYFNFMQSKSHNCCHANSGWLEIFTSFYFSFISNLFLILF